MSRRNWRFTIQHYTPGQKFFGARRQIDQRFLFLPVVLNQDPSGLLNQERARQEGTSLSFQLTGVFEESPYSQDSLVSFDLKIH